MNLAVLKIGEAILAPIQKRKHVPWTKKLTIDESLVTDDSINVNGKPSVDKQHERRHAK